MKTRGRPTDFDPIYDSRHGTHSVLGLLQFQVTLCLYIVHLLTFYTKFQFYHQLPYPFDRRSPFHLIGLHRVVPFTPCHPPSSLLYQVM